MKKESLVLKSDLEKGVRLFVFLFLIFTIPLVSQNFQNLQIRNVFVTTNFQIGKSDLVKDYPKILLIKNGDYYDLNKIRQSMKILYSLQIFSDIAVNALPVEGDKLDLYFSCKYKYLINNIVFKVNSSRRIKKSLLKEKIYIRSGTYLENSDIQESIKTVNSYLNSLGYFSPRISCSLEKKLDKPQVIVHFKVTTGVLSRVVKRSITCRQKAFEPLLKKTFNDIFYIPSLFQKKVDKFLEELRDKYYFYADIKTNIKYLNKEKSEAEVEVSLDTGKKYSFKFEGINDRSDLFLLVWKKKVFEKWALRETRTRILNHLKKRGYLRAEVVLNVLDSPDSKIIDIKVLRGQRYKLSKIFFEGNKSIPTERLFQLIESDDKANNKLWFLDPSDLEHDRAFLKVVYYLREGFQKVDIDFEMIFKKNKVDVIFKIVENQRVSVKSVNFRGNKIFESDQLSKISKIKAGDIFNQKNIDDAVETIKRMYYGSGYEDIIINAEVSRDLQKEIIFDIQEGESYTFGNLFIIGASEVQKKLINRLANLSRSEKLDSKKLLDFQNELENSTIFNRVQFLKIQRPNRVIDLVINVIANESEYYGIGFGVEKKQSWDVRTTVEYSKNNLFDSYLAFSSMVQIGPRETRGIVAFDSPYFFGQKINSRFRLWIEHEIYPSFKYSRIGLGESLIKNINTNAYILSSLNLYRSELTELSIPESSIDQIRDPFYTAAFNLSYLQENRDNPFNPSNGHYFKADLKLGLLDPFTSVRPFIKIRWDYQKNVPFLKRGVFSFSLRNGYLTNNMPITERYFGGGIYTFRGFQGNKLGPLTVENEPIGGGAFLFVNFDFTFPLNLVPIKDLYYAFFLDLGNVFSKTNDFDFAKLERACGMELKYRTSFGPLRICVGYNMRAYVEDRFVFFIGIGNVL